jgi:hypothetical protein
MRSLKMSKEDPVAYNYMIFVSHCPPLNLASSVDLIAVWHKQLAKCADRKDWWRPIDFEDEDGKVVVSLHSHTILGIIQGTIAAKPKDEEPQGKVGT